MQMIIYLQVKIYSEKDESLFLPGACVFYESCVVPRGGCVCAVLFPCVSAVSSIPVPAVLMLA